jgi:hypothetical protein
VRYLTPAEAVVIRSILANETGREVDRIRSSGIPRRTYQEIRRRAFREGWLSDAFVPNGPAYGRPFATFALVRPYLDQIEHDQERWASDSSVALLWSSPETLFAVSFSREPLEFAGRYREQLILTVDARRPHVPAYFDFEGLWAGLAGLDGLLEYPQPLPGTGAPFGSRLGGPMALTGVPPPMTPGRVVLATRESGDTRRGPSTLPRHLRRSARLGYLRYRVFPRFDRVPPFPDASVDGFAFVSGTLARDRRPEELFQALIWNARVFPFLFVTDGGTVLLGAATSSASRPGGSSILAEIGRYLNRIQVVRLPLRSISTTIDHEYGRLFTAPPGPQ